MEDVLSSASQAAALEERMNTKKAEYKTDVALLATPIAERDRAKTQ